MTAVGAINASAAAACVLAALAAAMLVGDDARPEATTARAGAAPGDIYVTLPDGGRGVADAAGEIAPAGDYRRIISGNTVSDWILAELCEFEQIAAITENSARRAPWRHRFAGLATIARLDDIEDVIARKPDLVIAASFGDPRRLARLREAGLVVFDIGAMAGVASTQQATRKLGALLGRLDRADILARRFERSLRAIASDVSAARRPRALYVSVYGKKLFGGTRGTAYHDILTHAGLNDSAASRWQGWPEYDAEDLLAVDPDLIVTRTGMAELLCRQPGLARLRACSGQSPNSIIEIDPFVLDDPGLGILEATEALHRAVHGRAK